MSRKQRMEKKKIPMIDLQGQQELKKLREACEEWGCFTIVNHNIPLPLAAEMKSVVRSLLDLPGDIKRRCDDVSAGVGYVGPCKANPLYETLGLYDPSSSQSVPTLCSRLAASPHQREVIEMYTKATLELLMDLARKLAESFGLAGYDPFREWSCQLWSNKYSFTPQSVGSSGVGPHTDYGFLTLLQIDEDVCGLEVMDTSGNYIPVDALSGTFLVNVGDIAKAWSNGRLCNVKHRVQCKEAAIRVSIATILLAPKEKVEAPPEFVDLEHPRLYVPFSHEEYAKLRSSNPIRTGVALDLLRIKS